MEKIDRLGWAAGFSFTAYGVRVGVRTTDAAILDRLRNRLPPGWKPSPSNKVERLYSFKAGGEGPRPGMRRFHLLYADITRFARTLEIEQALDSFESDLQLYVAEMARRRVFVHAGVVGWNGQAILIPGRSFTGKTTLVAELVRAGATYYSDEYAVLDAQGRVHPYLKSLGVRNDATARQTPLSIEVLGGRIGAKPLPVGLVILSEFRTGARWRPRRLSAGQGTLALLDNAVSARRQPERVLAALRQVAVNAQMLKGVRGEAAEIVSSISQIV